MSKRKKPRHRPLTCTVTRDGVLRIEIGVDTLACAMPRAWEVHRHERLAVEVVARPEERFSISKARGFSVDVRRAMLDEREDGSSLLTDMLDAAMCRAIEDGSEFFVDGEDRYYG